MDFDAQAVLFGGASFFLILLFLTQTLKEFFKISSHKVPMVALFMGVGMMTLSIYLRDDVEQAIAFGVLVAAAVSFSVRYVKNGQEDEPTTERRDSLQEHNTQAQGVRGERQPEQSVVTEQRRARVLHRTDTERLPDPREVKSSRDRPS